MVRIWSQLKNPDGSDSMPTFSGNDFAARLGDDFGTVTATGDTSGCRFGPGVPGYLGERSDGDTFWIGE